MWYVKIQNNVNDKHLRKEHALVWLKHEDNKYTLQGKNEDGEIFDLSSGGGGSGVTVIADPVTDLPVIDATYGYCRYLDATFTAITFVARLRNLVRVRLEMVSANPAITGNIVLVPVVNGVDGDPVIVPVGAELAEAVFDLELPSGTLALRRDTASASDTLNDGGAVTAIVTGIVLEVQYA